MTRVAILTILAVCRVNIAFSGEVRDEDEERDAQNKNGLESRDMFAKSDNSRYGNHNAKRPFVSLDTTSDPLTVMDLLSRLRPMLYHHLWAPFTHPTW